MNYYIDIKVLPDQGISSSLLMNSIFAKFHHALVEIGYGEVGISFPQAEKNLGNHIRLHGCQDALQMLMDINWLKGLADYASASPVTPVPNKCQYRVVRRVQAKSSVERLFRRSVKKGWLTPEEADAKMNESKEQSLKLPFLQLKSHSSGQSFRLFILQDKLVDSPVEGKFSAYALSSVATVPWF